MSRPQWNITYKQQFAANAWRMKTHKNSAYYQDKNKLRFFLFNSASRLGSYWRDQFWPNRVRYTCSSDGSQFIMDCWNSRTSKCGTLTQASTCLLVSLFAVIVWCSSHPMLNPFYLIHSATMHFTPLITDDPCHEISLFFLLSRLFVAFITLNDRCTYSYLLTHKHSLFHTTSMHFTTSMSRLITTYNPVRDQSRLFIPRPILWLALSWSTVKLLYFIFFSVHCLLFHLVRDFHVDLCLADATTHEHVVTYCRIFSC